MLLSTELQDLQKTKHLSPFLNHNYSTKISDIIIQLKFNSQV